MARTVFPYKKGKKRSRLLLFILSVSSVSAIAGALIYTLFWSDALWLKAVVVTGNEISASREIENAIKEELSSSSFFRRLLGNKSMLSWPEGEMTPPRRLPSILTAQIIKDWSEKTVSINITERKLFGIICQNREVEACYWFDPTGFIFAKSPSASGSLIPKVKDGNQRAIAPGEPIFGSETFTANLISAIQQLLQSNIIKPQLFIVKDLSLEEISVSTDGPELYFGLRSVPKDLNKILSGISQKTALSRLTYVDFRVENRVYYK